MAGQYETEKMKKTAKTQIKNLISKADAFASTNGEKILIEYEKKSRLLISWIQILKLHCRTGTADELLESVSSTIREAAAFAAIGAVRPCLFALRAQPDLLLSWIYFKDHPVEYASLCRTGENYILKKEALKYMSDNYERFSIRFGVMSQTISRKYQDPYRLLSAHIHSQSPFVISEITDFTDIIREIKLVEECAVAQWEVAEYLSDILFSLTLFSYHALPEAVKENINLRITTDGHKKLIFN